MYRLQLTIAVILLSSVNAFQFMSNWKVTPTKDLELQERTKEKFGDKSK